MKHHFTAFFLIASLLCVYEVKGQIRLFGQIINKTTQKPISGASIQMLNSNVGTTFDSSRNYTLTVPSTGYGRGVLSQNALF